MNTQVAPWSAFVLKIAHEFVQEYQIDDENADEIQALWLYFNHSKDFEQLNDYFSLEKSIMLMGGVGTGKTLLMRIFQRFLLLKTGKTFAYKHINQLANEYIETGFLAIQHYDQKDLWIDEVGLFDKENLKRYGNNANLVEEVIMHRYERFVWTGVKTHLTTNLTPKQIEQEYGSRVWSRLKELTNMLPLTGKDRRDFAKPKPRKKEADEAENKPNQQEINRDIATGIMSHYQLCRERGEYVDCGIYNMLAHIYYDFLDRHGIINFTSQEKWKALEEAKKINYLQEKQSFKNLIQQNLQSSNINTAKALLYKDFILNNDVPRKISQFLCNSAKL
ncbi:hypothetical protein [Raineya sp.]